MKKVKDSEEVKDIKKSEDNTKNNDKEVKTKSQKIKKEVDKEEKKVSKLGKETNEKEDKDLLNEEDIEINHEKLEKIKDEIKNTKKERKEKIKNSSLRKKLVRNFLISILITIYFLFIDLGINSIPITVYVLDLKTFAVFIAIIAIAIFEKAYKKDANYIAIHGIEMVVVGISTLLLLQLYSTGNEYFNYVLLAITLGMIAYYLIKCLIIYIRDKIKGKL